MSELFYEVILDFDEPMARSTRKNFNDLQSIFYYLKENDFINIYSSDDKIYIEKSKEEEIDTSKYPFYIKPDVRFQTGEFVPSIDFWIEEYMCDSFSNPEQRPYIEKYIRQ